MLQRKVYKLTTEKDMKIICFDFDGVIHSYLSGWQGIDVILDPVVIGIKELIDELRADGYNVQVFSARCREKAGIDAIKKYLNDHNIIVDQVATNKPPAIVSIDDRVICFNGEVEGIKEQIINFKPWTEELSNE